LIEAALLLVELIVFGVLLTAVHRASVKKSETDLGVFSYKESLTKAPTKKNTSNKANINA
jgi:hypothetical protein